MVFCKMSNDRNALFNVGFNICTEKYGVGYPFTMVTQHFTIIIRTFLIITIKKSNIDLNVKL